MVLRQIRRQNIDASKGDIEHLRRQIDNDERHCEQRNQRPIAQAVEENLHYRTPTIIATRHPNACPCLGLHDAKCENLLDCPYIVYVRIILNPLACVYGANQRNNARIVSSIRRNICFTILYETTIMKTRHATAMPTIHLIYLISNLKCLYWASL